MKLETKTKEGLFAAWHGISFSLCPRYISLFLLPFFFVASAIALRCHSLSPPPSPRLEANEAKTHTLSD